MNSEPSTPAVPDRATRPRRIVRLIASIILATGAIIFVYMLSDIFAPVLAALALAYMLDPLVRRLEKRGWRRKRAVIAVFAGCILVGVAVVGASVPFIVRDVGYAADAISRAIADPEVEGTDADGKEPDRSFGARLARAAERSETLRRILRWAEEEQIWERLAQWVHDNAENLLSQTWSAARGGLAFIWQLGWFGFMLVLFPVYLYFFMVGMGGVKGAALSVVPNPWRPKAEQMMTELGTALAAFFRGRLVVALAIGVFTATGFAVMGLRFGIPLGMAIGIASIIPFLNVVFLFPALVIAALDFPTFWGMGAIFAVYVAGQGLDPLLTPYLMSRGTGLHPVTIIVCLFVWGRLLGAVGLLLAVPLTATVKVLSREILLPLLVDPDPDPAVLPAGPAPPGGPT